MAHKDYIFAVYVQGYATSKEKAEEELREMLEETCQKGGSKMFGFCFLPGPDGTPACSELYIPVEDDKPIHGPVGETPGLLKHGPFNIWDGES